MKKNFDLTDELRLQYDLLTEDLKTGTTEEKAEKLRDLCIHVRIMSQHSRQTAMENQQFARENRQALQAMMATYGRSAPS